jgi:hypothetical protein
LSWLLNLGKAILKAVAPEAAARLLDRLLDRVLPTRRPKPKDDDHEPFPLSHKDVDHIEAQIKSATSPRAVVVPLRHAIRPPPPDDEAG